MTEEIIIEKDKETILLARMTKKGRQITIESGNDTNDFELYGFLKIYLKEIEERLRECLETIWN